MSGEVEHAVQGRYLFPVLIPIVGLGLKYLIETLPARSRLPAGMAIGVYFILGDFPFFLSHADGWLIP